MSEPDLPAETDWRLYTGTVRRSEPLGRLPDAPSWRTFDGQVFADVDNGVDRDQVGHLPGLLQRALGYQASDEVVDMVNAALLLRRPLLVSGRPGSGKSTLAYHVTYELRLGPVLHWPITSRSTLHEGLYQYDAIGRLQETPREGGDGEIKVGRYIRLGALGTGLLGRAYPRVVLIDEFDKSDIDLAYDLLNAFEEGSFDIPELQRLPPGSDEIEVMTADRTWATVHSGRVICNEFPLVIITSNAEREFPSAFQRRCLRYEMPEPTPEALAAMVRAHLGDDATARCEQLIERYRERRRTSNVTPDQLLNACMIALANGAPRQPVKLEQHVMAPIGGLEP